MATRKNSAQQSKAKQATKNPLADIAGKFGGEFWVETQSEIKRSRHKDKEETERLSDTNLNQQD
ncbi:MAG: hypothetical protein AAF383_17605 [Cyanobacteria bacterium P01_A01_bin.83]